MTRRVPVTKAEIQEYKDKLKAIDARPIKKIAEAKGRKKRKVRHIYLETCEAKWIKTYN